MSSNYECAVKVRFLFCLMQNTCDGSMKFQIHIFSYFSLYMCVYYSSVLLSTVNLPGKETFMFHCLTGSMSTTLQSFRAGSCCVRTIAPMKLSSSRCELFHCIMHFFDWCEWTKQLLSQTQLNEERSVTSFCNEIVVVLKLGSRWIELGWNLVS